MLASPAHPLQRATLARRELLLRLASAVALSSAPGAVRAATDPFVTWMQMLHDQWAVPAYEALDRSATGLVAVLDAAMAAGGNLTPAQLKDCQALWLQAMLTWRRLEALQMGPTLARRSSKAIDFWPTRPKVIQQAATVTATAPMTGTAAADAMERWGTAVKGLPALEWLLFPAGSEPNAPVMRGPVLCRYTLRIAMSLMDEVGLLLAGWRAEADRWRSATPPDVPAAKKLILNLLVGSIELLRGKKLEKAARAQALQVPGQRDALENFDSMRTKRTREFLLAHVDGVAQLLLGQTPGLAYTQGGPRWGLDDVLAEQGLGRPHGPALRRAVVAVRQSIAALPVDAATWTPARIAAPLKALVALRAVIDPPIASAWKVTIEFTDADGD
jgi:predicted lipoprotein